MDMLASLRDLHGQYIKSRRLMLFNLSKARIAKLCRSSDSILADLDDLSTVINAVSACFNKGLNSEDLLSGPTDCQNAASLHCMWQS